MKYAKIIIFALAAVSMFATTNVTIIIALAIDKAAGWLGFISGMFAMLLMQTTISMVADYLKSKKVKVE